VEIAAQITTMPLSLYYFHQFPNYFLLTGLIVIPLSSIIIYMTMFLYAISLWDWGTAWVAKGLIQLVDFMNWSVKAIENLPGAVVTDISFSLPMMLIFYLSLILGTMFLLYKKINLLRYFLVSVILILGLNLYQKINSLQQRKLYVYNVRGISSVNFIDGSNNVLFSDIVPHQTKMINALKGNWLSLGVEGERIIPFTQLNERFIFTNMLTANNENLFFKKNFFNFYGCRIVALREKFNLPEKTTNKLPVNFLILSNNIHINISDLLTVFKPSQIIIDASNSEWRIQKWINEAKKLNIKCYAVTKNGAFMADI